mmetsp:Transcript_43902/g.42428  ORF Transcript_43902/g.42428 Transcript_43902/m.42428 type:complete len:124 (-) Transcript_43902:230-601(-)
MFVGYTDASHGWTVVKLVDDYEISIAFDDFTALTSSKNAIFGGCSPLSYEVMYIGGFFKSSEGTRKVRLMSFMNGNLEPHENFEGSSIDMSSAGMGGFVECFYSTLLQKDKLILAFQNYQSIK